MITIVGIGQSLRGDDGAGQVAVHLWQETYPNTARNPEITIEIVENPGIGLLALIERAQVAFLVDAVQSGAPPGTIHTLKEEDLASFLAGADSAHGWGVAETLALGRKISPETMPTTIYIIGIEIGQIELGKTLSPEIEAILPKVAQLIQEIILSPTK